jgi:hypothetical protein
LSFSRFVQVDYDRETKIRENSMMECIILHVYREKERGGEYGYCMCIDDRQTQAYLTMNSVRMRKSKSRV